MAPGKKNKDIDKPEPDIDDQLDELKEQVRYQEKALKKIRRKLNINAIQNRKR
jgi:hypothetical protein